MRIPEFWTRVMELLTAENDANMIIDGYEPEIVMYREELDLAIPIKSIELVNGRIRVKV
jgi:hypothetical protein